MQEDLGANFTHAGPKIYKTKRDRKASYDRNNARQRDIYGIAKAKGNVVDVDYEASSEELTDDYYLNNLEIANEEPKDSDTGEPGDDFNDE